MSSEKTERPTDHRLREARKDGQVAKSKDFTQVLLLGSLLGYTLFAADDITREISGLLLASARLYDADFRAAVSMLAGQATRSMLAVLMPYVLLVIVVGIFAETIQTGILFSFKALVPKGDKLNPVTNLQQMFSMKSLVEFVKSCVKVALLSAIVYFVIHDALDALVKVPAAGIEAVGHALYDVMTTLVVKTFIAYGVIAGLDFAYQRYSYIKGLMMSMEEIKQEFKQMEGDPHVKQHRRELAKELAMGDGVQKTAKASVVVTNPTHLAIALFYEEEETPLPIVLAKGKGAMAARMVQIAKQEDIPVMQNIPVARALMRTAHVNQYIPAELVEPVAEVLRAVRDLAQERQGDPM
ncbi:type III secretion system export apparatus subunit SctU [Variovorax sp. KK3]|uniref:type III secretion system export apparatus subunit SctU n=1 Tax=Variovorax sp. KK3 TaxID=1855728 RepID=UPI00097BDDD4|nr:type III secretion system export apparatus subunit SctU [Variovorax sp. KK3]